MPSNIILTQVNVVCIYIIRINYCFWIIKFKIVSQSKYLYYFIIEIPLLLESSFMCLIIKVMMSDCVTSAPRTPCAVSASTVFTSLELQQLQIYYYLPF